jgi:hypothetical protein
MVKSYWGGLLAGAVFTFSSFHFTHAELGHLQLVSLEWLPLFLLCWYLLITKPSTLKGLGAALSLWLVILCDYYYFFYCVVAALLLVAWYMIATHQPLFFLRKEYWSGLLVFALITALLVMPVAGTLLLSNYRDPFSRGHNAVWFSLDLGALFIPGSHWFLNKWTSAYWSRLGPGTEESSVFITLPSFVLGGYALAKSKILEPERRRLIYFWLAVLCFFFLMALGPALQIAGSVVWDKSMPYSWLVKVMPFLGLSGVPVRMTVMVTLGMAVLGALGFELLLAHASHRVTWTIVLLGVFIFETVPSPLPAIRVSVPPYVTALAEMPNDGGVADLYTNSRSMELYNETIYGKPMVGGYISRTAASVQQKDAELTAAVEGFDYAKLWGVYHVRYLIMSQSVPLPSPPDYMIVRPVFHEDGVVIYRLECVCEAGPG